MASTTATAGATIVTRGRKRIACKICGQDGLEWVKLSTNQWLYAPFGSDDISGSVHATRPEECRASGKAPAAPTAAPAPTDLSGIMAAITVLQDNDETLRTGLNDVSAAMAGASFSAGVVEQYDDTPIRAAVEGINTTIDNVAKELAAVKANQPQRIEITLPNLPTVTISDPHPMFTNGVTMLNAIGQDGVLCLVGEAGSRKTSAVPQFAEALALEWETFPISIDTVKSDLVGYRNGLTGEYVEGPLFRGYTKPILMGFDEADKMLSGIATIMNGAFANEQYGFPHGMFKRNPEARFMMMMNTYGRGPDALYNSGQQLDGATLDRLVYLPWNTNWADVAGSVGLAVANHVAAEYPGPGKTRDVSEFSDWADYVIGIHAVIEDLNIRVHVGGRAIRIGAKMLAAGIDRKLVEFSLIWGHMSTQDADTVKANL